MVNILKVCAHLSNLSIHIGIVRFSMLINTLLMVTVSFYIYMQRDIKDCIASQRYATPHDNL